MSEFLAGDRRLDPYLTRKAQARLDPHSLVYELATGRWILERAGVDDVDLGENFGRAKEALQLLISAARNRAK